MVWPLVFDPRETMTEEADVASIEECLNMADITKCHRLDDLVKTMLGRIDGSVVEYVLFSTKTDSNSQHHEG